MFQDRNPSFILTQDNHYVNDNGATGRTGKTVQYTWKSCRKNLIRGMMKRFAIPV